jgi:hypothetical protein
VAVLVALSLSALVGVAAIAVDGGLLQDERRRAQAAADAAAMAAAEDLYVNYLTYYGVDTPTKTANDSALKNAAANGYSNDAVRSIVTVNIPPTSGPFTGLKSYVEVIIQYNQPRGFSNIMGNGDMPVKARAVARGYWSDLRDGILVLDPTGSGSLTAGGNGAMTLIGAATGPTTRVLVNSNSSTAVIANGGGALTAPEYDITGVPGTSTIGGATIVGPIKSGVQPTPDPLAYLPQPDPTTVVGGKKTHISGSGNTTITIYPGVYVGGITVSGQASLVMMPGVYYMQGGGFGFTGSGSLTANGVMIYNAPVSTSDTVNIQGGANITFSPPTTGIYQGMAIFQDRTSTVPINIAGGGGMKITGTFYAAGATLKISGSGVNNTIGSQYISYDLSLGGLGNVTIDYTAAPHPRSRVLTLVE